MQIVYIAHLFHLLPLLWVLYNFYNSSYYMVYVWYTSPTVMLPQAVVIRKFEILVLSLFYVYSLAYPLKEIILAS